MRKILLILFILLMLPLGCKSGATFPSQTPQTYTFDSILLMKGKERYIKQKMEVNLG